MNAASSLGSPRLARLVAGLLLAGTWQPAWANHAPSHTLPTSDASIVVNALSAAPEGVAQGAAVVVLDRSGAARRLRDGSNGFTCIADDPATPANDPLCVDASGWQWVVAWLRKAEPPSGTPGLGYRLQGGATPSNLDPFATGVAPGREWRQEPPQVIIFGPLPQPQPQPPAAATEAPDMTVPWLRWPGTRYQQLVIPLR